MKKIVLEPGSKGAKFIEELKKSKEESKERIAAMYPSKRIMELMKEKTQQTYDLNKGTLDKSTFQLGMMAMYFLLDKEGLIKKEEI